MAEKEPEDQGEGLGINLRDHAQLIADYFATHGKDGGRIVCPIDGGEHFAIDEELCTNVSYDRPRRGAPLVAAGCKSCGHILMFSAYILGIVPDPPEKSEGQSHGS